MPCIIEEIPQEENYNKYGDTAWEIEIRDIGKHGSLARIPFSEIPGGGSLIEGDLFTQWKINQFRPTAPKQGNALAKIEN